MEYIKRTWVEVSLDNLAHNYKEIRKKMPQNRTLFRRSISWNTATSCSSNFWEPACG